MAETLESKKLIQFLMGLGDMYDSIRGQVLIMEPFPSVNKAYAMILCVEKQREVNLSYVGVQENSALLTRTQQGAYGRGRGNNQARRRGSQDTRKGIGQGNDKDARYCDYCNTLGHVRETYFH